MRRNKNLCGSTIKSHLDCHDLLRKTRNDKNYRFISIRRFIPKTIEVMAVWLSWFFGIFGAETRLIVCEAPKIPKSAELHTPEQIAKRT